MRDLAAAVNAAQAENAQEAIQAAFPDPEPFGAQVDDEWDRSPIWT